MPAFAALVARHRSWVLAAAALLGLVAAGGLAPSPPHRDAASRAASVALPVISETAFTTASMSALVKLSVTGSSAARDGGAVTRVAENAAAKASAARRRLGRRRSGGGVESCCGAIGTVRAARRACRKAAR